jgi:hypothetical protein
MLNCTETSRAKKTAGLAVTYRAAPGDMYGTCPDTCPLKPVQTETREIDREYEKAVRDSVPKNGRAFLFTHFAPHTWGERNTGNQNQCAFNYSAPTLEAAANETMLGNASVAVAPADYWKDRASDKVTDAHGVRGVRCPDETTGIGCARCGNGTPLCARPNRDYFIVFTAHGPNKKLAGENATPGGCYAGMGNVAIHWRNLSKQNTPEISDAEKHRAFVKTLRPGSILRPHIAGDIGLQN